MIHSEHIMLEALTVYSTLELYHKRGTVAEKLHHRMDTIIRMCLLCDLKSEKALLLAKKFRHHYGCDIERMYNLCKQYNDKVLEFLA